MLRTINQKLKAKKKALFWVLILTTLFVAGFLAYWLSRPVNLKKTQQNARQAQWVSYSDAQERFSVLLPKTPDIKGDEYLVMVDKETYKVSVLSASSLRGAEGDEAISSPLDNRVQQLLKSASPDAKLIYAQRQKDAGGVIYLDFKIQTASSEAKGRAFLFKDALFELSYTTPLGFKDVSNFNKFLSSFQLN